MVPAGCGSKRAWLPEAAGARIISLRQICSIVAHEAADLTVTVEAGATLGELNELLMKARQHLPLDPPFPRTTTIGSLIAGDGYGPLRLSQGKVRDLLVGITVVLADGQVVRGGGRVVKNVAGYDLMKLFTGSGGTLGIVAEATFKLRPYPAGISQFVVPCASLSEATILARHILASAITPLYLVALHGPGLRHASLDTASLLIGCAGSAAEREVQQRRLQEIVNVQEQRSAIASAVYGAVRDLPALAVEHDSLGARVSMLPSRLAPWIEQVEATCERQGLLPTMVVYPGNGAVCWRCSGATTALAEDLVAATRAAGGWLEFDVIADGLRPLLTPWPTPPPGVALMRGIKHALDPQNRVNPGRFGEALA